MESSISNSSLWASTSSDPRTNPGLTPLLRSLVPLRRVFQNKSIPLLMLSTSYTVISSLDCDYFGPRFSLLVLSDYTSSLRHAPLRRVTPLMYFNIGRLPPRTLKQVLMGVLAQNSVLAGKTYVSILVGLISPSVIHARSMI